MFFYDTLVCRCPRSFRLISVNKMHVNYLKRNKYSNLILKAHFYLTKNRFILKYIVFELDSAIK